MVSVEDGFGRKDQGFGISCEREPANQSTARRDDYES